MSLSEQWNPKLKMLAKPTNLHLFAREFKAKSNKYFEQITPGANVIRLFTTIGKK
jgi:hypothetical protein